MWRTSKADVQAELGIPPQTHNTTALHMSPIERHFYARQHQVQLLVRMHMLVVMHLGNPIPLVCGRCLVNF